MDTAVSFCSILWQRSFQWTLLWTKQGEVVHWTLSRKLILSVDTAVGDGQFLVHTSDKVGRENVQWTLGDCWTLSRKWTLSSVNGDSVQCPPLIRANCPRSAIAHNPLCNTRYTATKYILKERVLTKIFYKHHNLLHCSALYEIAMLHLLAVCLQLLSKRKIRLTRILHCNCSRHCLLVH